MRRTRARRVATLAYPHKWLIGDSLYDTTKLAARAKEVGADKPKPTAFAGIPLPEQPEKQPGSRHRPLRIGRGALRGGAQTTLEGPAPRGIAIPHATQAACETAHPAY
jgi:hypothetical protein